jgi:hypothetical protein
MCGPESPGKIHPIFLTGVSPIAQPPQPRFRLDRAACLTG